MSNLVLTRKAGQSVRLLIDGREDFLEVLQVSGGSCVVHIASRKSAERIRFKASMQLADGVVVTVLDLAKGHAKLGFDAPREVHILRTELIKEAS